jgi:hypothetical protein
MKLATASKLRHSFHHNWTFSQVADGTFVAERNDGEKIYRRGTLSELLELLDFFKEQGFFIRKQKSLIELLKN